uniref:Protein Tat n=1 Tax=Simian immunodeficiency virus TaxID=11723 RepID=A0A159D794_SIV|nr:tat protein [Simian immunodeficiency virus]
MDREEAQRLLLDLHRPLQKCDNKCYCKRCCYHCQLCFLQKGLGVNYAPRPRRKKIAKPATVAESNQSISTLGRDSQATSKEKTEVETNPRTDQTSGRKNLEHKRRTDTGSAD